METLFYDRAHGGFFFSGAENETLIVRSKEAYDQALPSCNAVAALNLLRLGRITGNTRWESLAEETMGAFSDTLQRVPTAHVHMLGAVEFLTGPAREIVIAGDPDSPDTRAMIRTVHRAFLPNTVLLLRPPGPAADKILRLAPSLRPMEPEGTRTTAYICEQYSCREPVNDPESLEAMLAGT